MLEVLLYAYMTISISMIFFNIWCVFRRKGSEAWIKKKALHLRLRIKGSRRERMKGAVLAQSYRKSIEKKMHRVSGLMVFNQAVEPLLDQEADREYFAQLAGVFCNLIPYYRKNNTIQAYFSFTLSQFEGEEYTQNGILNRYLLSCVIGDSIYLRENSLAALYRYGDEQVVFTAIEKMNRNQIQHHPKLLTNGLLTFRGRHNALARLLMKHFPAFMPGYQLAIVNYLGFVTPLYKTAMLDIIESDAFDKEVTLAAMRYFRRNRYEHAVDVLIDYLQQDDPNGWEYAATAAAVLESYRGNARVDRSLLAAMDSSEWHVRQNVMRACEGDEDANVDNDKMNHGEAYLYIKEDECV